MRIKIFTDGACIPNPGNGGWAAILIALNKANQQLHYKELSGREAQTTNNRMELRAILEALKSLKRENLAGVGNVL